MPISRGANLYKAQLQGANLARAKLQGAKLSRAKLQGANLTEAKLIGAKFIEAKLQGAILYKAQLQGGDLRSAQLRGADLYMAQLQGAKLSGGRLTGKEVKLGALLYGGLFEGPLKDADLSLAVLLKLGRGKFTQKNYDTLEKNLSKRSLDEQQMSKMLIGRADDLVFGPDTHHALCDEVDPDKECLTLEQKEQFVKEWVEYIVSLACPDSYISEGVARQAIRYQSRPVKSDAPRIDTLRRDKASMLAHRLLSPGCKGGADLPDNVREILQKLSRESGPNGVTKPSSNVSSP